MMFRRTATTTIALTSPGRDRALTRSIADYFGLSYPHELTSAALLLIAVMLLRIFTIARYRFGPDEPQHLHVVWGWARGFVQYRDLADNHMPLFQILCAPIYKLIGDRGTILYWMRIVLQPVYIVAFWCTYRIGSLLFSRRVGVWAAILVGLFFDYLFCSVEFRTDNLWAPLWLLCMVVLLNGALTTRRAAIAGFLLGLCFGVSMKTSLLAVSILIGGSVTLVLVGRERLGIGRGRNLGGALAAFFASALSVPATIAAAFAFYGIWPQFRYWVFDNNIVPGVRNHPTWWVIIFAVGFPLVILGAHRIAGVTPGAEAAARRSFVLVTTGFYITALFSFWPFLSGQDSLPFYPLVFVIGTGAVLTIWDRWARNRTMKIWRVVPIPAWFGVCELVVALLVHPLWKDEAKLESDLLRDTLKLTEPGDFVFDRKGETVFRQRCFYPVVETFTEERFRRGLMADNAIQRCIDTHTCVATLPTQMPAATLRWVEQNYLPIGYKLRVAGVLLHSATDEKHFDFEIVIPASYKIIARDIGTVTGVLDGERYERRERFLSPGIHTFVQTSTGHDLVVFWAQAVDRHFTPFNYVTLPGR